MTTHERVLAQLRESKKVRLEGGFNCIPWKNLPKFSTVIPGIVKGRYYIVTANSKVGKTILADYLFVYEPIDFIRRFKPNVKVKIFYFSLELSKEEKVKQVMVNRAYKEKGLSLSPEKLDSLYEDYILPDDVQKVLEDQVEFFKFFDSVVTYIDNIRNPFGIYKYVRDYAEAHGDYYTKDGRKLTLQDVQKSPLLIDHYIPHDPNEYVIIITDHIGLLTPEQGNTLHSTMSLYSNNYCLKMRDRWKYVVVNVQQQAAEQEKQQYNLAGKSIIDKLRPSADGLGDNKLTGRDCDLMLGLFAPARYKIPEYAGYDITKLGDHHRELSVLLNRRGYGFKNVQMYYNGATGIFEELPVPEKIDYNKFKTI